MKTAKVISIIKKAKRAYFFQRFNEKGLYEGAQWLSDGPAAYYMEGLPPITREEEFQKLFDIKERDGLIFKIEDTPDHFGIDRYGEGVVSADYLRMTIKTEGNIFRVFQSDTGRKTVFVKEKYLEPFNGKEEVDFAIQTFEGDRFLCVFEGLVKKAIISETIFDHNEKLRIRNQLKIIDTELQRSLAWERLHTGTGETTEQTTL